MDILHLTPEAHELLQNWGEENRLLVDSVLPYNKSYFKKLFLFEYSNSKGLTWSDNEEEAIEWYGEIYKPEDLWT